jgi:hypothetical protein
MMGWMAPLRHLSANQVQGPDRPGPPPTPSRSDVPISPHELRRCRHVSRTLADIARQP